MLNLHLASWLKSFLCLKIRYAKISLVNDLKIDFAKMQGLIPAVIQDAVTGEVLMLAFQNKESYVKTLETGEVYFFSRSRNTLWKKGETSGNILKVVEVLVDCDNDSVLIKVQSEPNLKVCHTGKRSCFFTQVPVVSALFC
jgi:phosphoribosyl-AMP cyclohydrolase